MTESGFPFQTTAVTSAEAQPSTSNRTKLLALGGAAGLVLLAVVGYLLLFAGGGDIEEGAATTPQTNSTPVPAASPSSGPVPVPVQRLSAKTFGRDPYKALIVDSAASDTAVSTDTVGVTAASVTQTTGTTEGATVTTSTGTTADTTDTTGTTSPATSQLPASGR